MVVDLNLSSTLQKIDLNSGCWRLVGAIAFNKLLSQLIEEASWLTMGVLNPSPFVVQKATTSLPLPPLPGLNCRGTERKEEAATGL